MLPHHVGIIPDGNRRWARAHNLPLIEGHRKGFARGIEVGKRARERGINILTFWAFSTDNWKRSREEVSYLMKLYERMIDINLQEAMQEHIRIIHLGRKDRIGQTLREKIIQAEKKTRDFNTYYLCIALDYGGRNEIMRAFARYKRQRGKKLSINEENFYQFLDTKDLSYPDVDLVIRTSGEERLSGFMPYQAAYAECIFYPKYFPDFSASDFDTCLDEFEKRQRRFGI